MKTAASLAIKKLPPACALLVGLFATEGAFAQSSVRLYGALDVYVAHQTSSGTGSINVLNSGFNPNSLGFTGTEDLGGGLAAGFTLEGQPLVDTGTFGQGGKIFGRQSLVYLANDWGRVGLGRQQTPARAFGIKYSTSGWLSTDAFANLELAMGSAITSAMNVDTVGARLSNSISYSSPKIAGFTVHAITSLNEDGKLAEGQAKMTIASISYANGPIEIDFVASRIPEVSGSQIPQSDWGLGATYDLGFARLQLAYQAKRGQAVTAANNTVGVPGSEATDHIIGGGVQVPFGPHMVGLSYAVLSVDDRHRGLRQANIGAPFSSLMDDAQAWSLGYSYSLSKRTQLFAAFGRLGNSSSGTASLAPGLRPSAGGVSRVGATGIRHIF